MKRVSRSLFAITLGLAVALFAAACGDDGGDDGAGKGPRVTDPAKVASSTPIANAILYTIRQDGSVSASGGAGTASVPAGTVKAGTTPAQGGSYTVKSGDNCASIASNHNVTLEALLAANRLIAANCGNLKIDDILKIPAAATTAATPRAGTTASSGKSYTVAAGDNCQKIADSHTVTVAALLAANPSINANCSNINVGQTLKIP